MLIRQMSLVEQKKLALAVNVRDLVEVGEDVLRHLSAEEKPVAKVSVPLTAHSCCTDRDTHLALYVMARLCCNGRSVFDHLAFRAAVSRVANYHGLEDWLIARALTSGILRSGLVHELYLLPHMQDTPFVQFERFLAVQCGVECIVVERQWLCGMHPDYLLPFFSTDGRHAKA